jgi:hypothetical protein
MKETANRTTAPSQAWRDAVFGSPPRRDANRINKSTTRVQLFLPHTGQFVHVEGNHEATALMLIKHLWRNDMIKRAKVQPFSLDELDGRARRVPDFLVELSNGDLVVIQVKAARFITSEVQEQFDQEREFLEYRGFRYCVWTDKTCLGHPVSETVRAIDRGTLLPIAQVALEKVRDHALAHHTLGDLLNEFGWDTTAAALAQGAAFINILEKLNETSTLNSNFSSNLYGGLFSNWNATVDFWDTLAA